jgi:hypothetical protein
MAQSASRKQSAPPETPDERPDFQRMWSNATIIPLERTKELAARQLFSEQQYAGYQKKSSRVLIAAVPDLTAIRR